APLRGAWGVVPGWHADLTRPVDQRERRVGLQVEVLLPADLELAREPVRGARQTRLDVTARHRARRTLERAGLDRLGERQQRRQRLDVDLDGLRAEDRKSTRLNSSHVKIS